MNQQKINTESEELPRSFNLDNPKQEIELVNFEYGIPFLKDGEQVVVPEEVTKSDLQKIGISYNEKKSPFRINDLLRESNKPVIANGEKWVMLVND